MLISLIFLHPFCKERYIDSQTLCSCVYCKYVCFYITQGTIWLRSYGSPVAAFTTGEI
jgi:hypothetical protein